VTVECSRISRSVTPSNVVKLVLRVLGYGAGLSRMDTYTSFFRGAWLGRADTTCCSLGELQACLSNVSGFVTKHRWVL
jgi:hypothetical protein